MRVNTAPKNSRQSPTGRNTRRVNTRTSVSPKKRLPDRRLQRQQLAQSRRPEPITSVSSVPNYSRLTLNCENTWPDATKSSTIRAVIAINSVSVKNNCLLIWGKNTKRQLKIMSNNCDKRTNSRPLFPLKTRTANAQRLRLKDYRSGVNRCLNKIKCRHTFTARSATVGSWPTGRSYVTNRSHTDQQFATVPDCQPNRRSISKWLSPTIGATNLSFTVIWRKKWPKISCISSTESQSIRAMITKLSETQITRSSKQWFRTLISRNTIFPKAIVAHNLRPRRPIRRKNWNSFWIAI